MLCDIVGFQKLVLKQNEAVRNWVIYCKCCRNSDKKTTTESWRSHSWGGKAWAVIEPWREAGWTGTDRSPSEQGKQAERRCRESSGYGLAWVGEERGVVAVQLGTEAGPKVLKGRRFSLGTLGKSYWYDESGLARLIGWLCIYGLGDGRERACHRTLPEVIRFYTLIIR